MVVSCLIIWYSASGANDAVGTVIGGATSSTYSPSTATAGTFYFFCEVTNTIPDNHDGGTKTAKVKSIIACVEVKSNTPTSSEIIDRFDAKLFPNPILAGAEFTVQVGQSSSAYIVEIYNASGSLLQKFEKTDQLFRMSAPVEPGIYMMRITGGNMTGTFRLVVQQ